MVTLYGDLPNWVATLESGIKQIDKNTLSFLLM